MALNICRLLITELVVHQGDMKAIKFSENVQGRCIVLVPFKMNSGCQ
jgi:hypothetical protein